MVEPAFQSEAVAKRFAAYSDGMRDRLLALRALILETAADTDGVGSIEETLKWNRERRKTRRDAVLNSSTL